MAVRLFQKIFRFLLVVILIWLGYLAYKKICPYFSHIDIKTLAPVITGTVTLIVGLGAVLISQSKIKKRELEEAHREKKIELYTRFNNKIFEMFAGVNKKIKGKQPSEQDLIDFMFKFKKDLMFRASPQVIKAVIKFEKASNQPQSNKTVLRKVDDIYLAMRKDIGQSNFGLSNLEMIKIFLKDKNDVWQIL